MFQVKDYIEISVDMVERAILMYGSVMTCMKWGSAEGDSCYMTKYIAGKSSDGNSYRGKNSIFIKCIEYGIIGEGS